MNRRLLSYEGKSKEDLENGTNNLLDKYTELYEFAPVGYLTLDSNGKICEVNLTGASLLGIERTQLIDKKFSGIYQIIPLMNLTNF